MDEHAAEGKLTALVTDYARSRAVAVSRGEETPGLAALLVGRYGRGIYDAADVLLGRPAAQRIVEILDRAGLAMEPEGRGPDQERWREGPADTTGGGWGRATDNAF